MDFGKERRVNADNQDRENSEKKEISEAMIDLELETLILEYGQKINEGNNGVIFLADTSYINSVIAKELGLENTQGKKAVKMLKVYSEGLGRHEFEMHQKAYQIIGDNTLEYATIPKPLMFRDIELSPYAIQELTNMGIKLSSRAEVILMDYVEGKDLAEIMGGEALVRVLPELFPDADAVSNMTVNEMYRLLGGRYDAKGQVIHFNQPGGKSANEGEREFERRKIDNENAIRIYKLLQGFGFNFDKSILDRLQNTVDLLHSHGIVHRDLHERNVMISGKFLSGQGRENSNVYIIDFGTAQEFSGNYNSSKTLEKAYTGFSGVKFDQDEIVLRRLEILSKTQTDIMQEKKMEGVKEIERVVEKLRKDKEWVKKRDLYLDRMIKKDDFSIDDLITKLSNYYLVDKINAKHRGASSRQVSLFADFVLSIKDRQNEKLEDIVKMIKKIKSNKISTGNASEDRLIDKFYDDLVLAIKKEHD